MAAIKSGCPQRTQRAQSRAENLHLLHSRLFAFFADRFVFLFFAAMGRFCRLRDGSSLSRMHFLLASIVCSVAVSVLLKLAPRWRVDLRQAIAVNYLVASLLAWSLLGGDPAAFGRFDRTGWGLLLALGIGLPAMFWVLALAVRRSGVVRTDAAMRLSLLLPLIAAFTVFGEPLSPAKGIGVVLGLVAITLIVLRRAGHAEDGKSWSGLLLVVFAGMGVIDILFKLMARLGQGSSASVLLAAFVLAAVLSLAAVAWLYRSSRASWRPRHLLTGLLLGLLNFGNIVFYIQAHRALPTNPALVFAAMNIGVIVTATVVGMLALRERPGRANLAGLALAVIAVVILAAA